MNIKQCEFKQNKAYYLGGALTLTECNSTIENSVFMNNSAGVGGALHISVNHFYRHGDITTIDGTNFSSNIANYKGGAIFYNVPNFKPQGFLHVITFQATVTISNNRAHGVFGGGGLTLECDDNNLQAIVQGRLIVANNTIGHGNGGGIYLDRIMLTLQENGTLELLHNNASENGGGMYAKHSTINTNFSFGGRSSSVYFLGNHAVNGGGLYLCNSQVYIHTLTYDSTLQSSAVQFTKNSASLGGALYLEENCNLIHLVPANKKKIALCKFVQCLHIHKNKEPTLTGTIKVHSIFLKTKLRPQDQVFTNKHLVIV